LLAVILYRMLAAPLVPPRAPQAIAGGARTAGGAVGSGPAAASAASGASAPRAGMASGAVAGMTPGTSSGSAPGTIPATTAGSAPGGAETRPAAPQATAASSGGEGAATAAAPSPTAAARARGKRTRLAAGDATAATSRAGTPADGTSPTFPAGRSASGAEKQGAGGGDERAATSAGAGGGAAGSTPDDELRQLGIEIETESDQIRNLYADFLSQKEKGGSRLSDSDDKLKDELKDLQRAAEGFHAQFQTGFWARTRNRFGRLGHSEDQKAQVTRVARTLVGSGSRVDALMAEVKPDPAVRELWRRIHQQCRRIAEICGV
jgi:hypothetical protein